jgi:transposase
MGRRDAVDDPDPHVQRVAETGLQGQMAGLRLTRCSLFRFGCFLDTCGENCISDTVMACDFLLKWPTLEKLQKSRPETISRFYNAHNMRRRNAVEERLNQIRSALPLTTDAPVIEPSVFMAQSIARQLHSVIDAVTLFDQRIKELFQKHPDAGIFSSFPGAGPNLAPRLLAAMGSDRSRFRSSLEVAEYSGIAPVTERSGKSKWVHRRFACSKFVKQSFHEFAAQSIFFCAWARCYYDRKKTEGKKHHSAIRALAYRWIRIIYRCWKDRSNYLAG